MNGIPEILFLCVHNAGRSQMAAALLAHRAEGRVNVRSAGSTPAAEINQAVIEVMAEIGVDITEGFPQAAHRRVCPSRRRPGHHGLRRSRAGQ